MNVLIENTFIRDLKPLPRDVRRRVEAAVLNLEAAETLRDVRSIESLKGDSAAFRIRVGDYRIGLRVSGGDVVLVRCLHRREIYRDFP